VDYFPAFLQLDDKPCLLVGGGAVAARKAKALLAAGATLTIVSPEVVPAIDEMLAGSKRLRLIRRRFAASDVTGNWLVVSATGDALVEQEVAAASDAQRVFCNAVDKRQNCSYISPAIIDRSPLIVAVSSGGHAPVLARKIRAQIESLLPVKLGELASLAGRWRARVASRYGDFRARLRSWDAFFDGRIGSEVLSGRGGNAEQLIAELLSDNAGAGFASGEAWLVGAGPGDPGLLTLRALQVLQFADVILHDRLVSSDILALARRDATMISVGKTPGCKANSQEEINALLVRLVREGNRVCRLKGGDPFIFGRGGEELAELIDENIEFQVVPGITAASGCASYAGIPLTHRDYSQACIFVTGHRRDGEEGLNWEMLSHANQTVVFYMGLENVERICSSLKAHGRDPGTPAALVEKGTTSSQRVFVGDLDSLPGIIADNDVRAPTLILVGEVVALHNRLGWYKPGKEIT